MFVRSRVFYATKKLINRKIECFNAVHNWLYIFTNDLTWSPLPYCPTPCEYSELDFKRRKKQENEVGRRRKFHAKISMRKFVKMPDLYWSSISDCLSGVRELTAWLRTANICISRSSPHLLTALNSPRAPSAPAAFSACSAIPAGWIENWNIEVSAPVLETLTSNADIFADPCPAAPIIIHIALKTGFIWKGKVSILRSVKLIKSIIQNKVCFIYTYLSLNVSIMVSTCTFSAGFNSLFVHLKYCCALSVILKVIVKSLLD